MNEITTFQKPSEMAAYLERAKSQIGLALPKHLNPDRMLRLALTCWGSNRQLKQCDAQSIVASIIVASQLGLEPGIAGQGYLIPYKTTCTFVPGWQGLVGLLNNSGRATAWTGAVFEGDIWDFQLGSAPRCVHVPGPNFGDSDKMTWVYACGKVNGSEQPVVEAWPMSRVWKHRDRFNKVGQRHYSFEHPEMYARKVVLLQVLKYMPRSIELNNALVAANAADMGNTSKVEDGLVIEVEASRVEKVVNPPTVEDRKTPPAQQGEEQSQEPAHQQGEENQEQSDLAPVDVLEDPAKLTKWLREKCAELGLDESQAVLYVKNAKRCGASVKQLSDIASSGMKWIAERIAADKDAIAAL